jgi:predicted PurR-regulated permease PerM
VIDLLHAIIAVPEVYFMLIIFYNVVAVVVVVVVVVVCPELYQQNLSIPYKIQTRHLHLLDQLNNDKHHGQLNYILQKNSEGFTPNIPVTESEKGSTALLENHSSITTQNSYKE